MIFLDLSTAAVRVCVGRGQAGRWRECWPPNWENPNSPGHEPVVSLGVPLISALMTSH